MVTPSRRQGMSLGDFLVLGPFEGGGLRFAAFTESTGFAFDAGHTDKGCCNTISTRVPAGSEISSPRVNSTLAKASPPPISAP